MGVTRQFSRLLSTAVSPLLICSALGTTAESQTRDEVLPAIQMEQDDIPIPLLGVPSRWILKPDAQPSIAPNSEILIFVDGMDSRTEEADDITKALFEAMAAMPQSAPPPVYPPIANNRGTVQFQFQGCTNGVHCPPPPPIEEQPLPPPIYGSQVQFVIECSGVVGCPEPCDHMDEGGAAVTPSDVVNGVPTRIYFAPIIPPRLLDTKPPAGTQINVPPAHNLGANEGRLQKALRDAAAAALPLQSLTQAAFKFATGDADDAVWGNAFADLSVTGHRAFANFRQTLPGEWFCESLIGQRPPPLTADQILAGWQPPPPMTNDQVLAGCEKALDRAYRVANFLRTGERGDTPALKTAKTAERNALGWIAVSGEDDSPHRPVNVPSSDFPQFDLPDVPVDAPLGTAPQPVHVRTRYTIAQSQTPGRNLVVISMDLPTSGYADNLDYRRVSPLSAIGSPKTNNSDFSANGDPPMAPLLDFIETFVVSFVNTLDSTVPFKNNIKAVMGGSLGGSISLRLGRRGGVPWFPEFIVWSAASIWDSLAGGADVLKHKAPLTEYVSAQRAMDSPQSTDRAEFFGSWDKPLVPLLVPSQAETWFSDYYLCKHSNLAGARLDRQETYDSMFLAWHHRLAAEQVIYSHRSKDPTTNQPLFMANRKPTLLSCGLEDDFIGADICTFTHQTAQEMTTTPGKALFLGQTGHSIDNERRQLWARQMISFLGL